MARFSTGNGFPDVVVTGVAMTTALATDVDTTWKKLLDGQSGIRKLDDPWVEQYNLPVQIGGHLLEDFDHELTRKELHRLSYLQKMSTVLSRRVWANAGSPEVDPVRLLALRDGVTPPTLNLRNLDPQIDLDVVAGQPRPGDYNYAISNSFGFGGHNVALAFGRH
jgi:3-oxoacyl-(acyl-carrier-protein) synthase